MSEEEVRIVTVDAANVGEEGFFCYKSKPKSAGYQNKLAWLKSRLAEGMQIKILYEGKRSVAFIEYVPGEAAWRAVNAEGYMLIHCLWVVGKGKGKGYATRLLNECEVEARQRGQRGVAMVTSTSVWLADKPILVKNGFEVVGQAPPTFELLVKRFDDGPLPTFPTDWEARAAQYGPGVTVVYTDQCPYIPDAVQGVRDLAAETGAEVRTVKLESSQQVRDAAPSAYGVFNVVHQGELVTYHYIDSKKRKQAFLTRLSEADE